MTTTKRCWVAAHKMMKPKEDKTTDFKPLSNHKEYQMYPRNHPHNYNFQSQYISLILKLGMTMVHRVRRVRISVTHIKIPIAQPIGEIISLPVLAQKWWTTIMEWKEWNAQHLNSTIINHLLQTMEMRTSKWPLQIHPK